MFVRFTERMRTNHDHHAFKDMGELREVYLKVLMSEGKDEKGVPKFGQPMYLLKIDRGDPKGMDCLDYIANYGDKEIFRHPDFPGFNDNVQEEVNDETGMKVGYAYGYVWIAGGELEEMVAENNVAYKFLLKSR